ncbi:PAX3- and PAX7-binding protein 1 isoform X2 [Sphaerodactylus townsendi]|uniref:PAX3- and PAX7-binding protein 1 isoform X2 n=1 Tax=Sphaerodactylus townsendi TaxID=933632 RepID=UPI002026B34A|nr:PAX3- and PAX7-binding protein 1 isoform X2 [Sphaerodactylus townsendi]
MFRKARRVNVRKRNQSEEEDEERSDEPPQSQLPLPLPLPPPGGDGPTAEAAQPLPRPPLLPLPTGCVPLVSPAGGGGGGLGGFTFGGAEAAGRGSPVLTGPPPVLPPPPPPFHHPLPPQQPSAGNNGFVSAAAKAKERKARNKEAAGPQAARGSLKLLSFQDEEEAEEVFKVKKSSYSKKIVKLLKREYKEDLEKSKTKVDSNSSADAEQSVDKLGLAKDILQEDGAANSEQGEEEMEVESEKEEEKPKAAGAFSSALSSLNVLRPGEIPDAAFIHAARKKRQMARELGDFLPLDNDPGKGRLVREDENDASDDEDDDEKRRIVFSVKEKSQRQKIAEEIGIEGSDDEALVAGEQDEELSRWEQEQIRKGINIPQVQASQPAEVNNLYYHNTYQAMPYGSSYGIPYTYAAYGSSEAKSQKTDNTIPFKTPSNEMAPVSIDLVKKQLKDRLDSMKEFQKANQQQHEKHQESRDDSIKTIENLEGSSGGIAERYKFLQEMRGYVQDLLECFNEKVPLINELEASMHQLYKQRASRLVQRRQDDIKDESSEFSSHSSKALMAPNLDSFGRDRALYQEHVKRRTAEREARRARRRLAREQSGKMTDHLEGLSSDDEETSTDTTNFKMERDRILKESSKVFEDVLENFYSIDYIKTQFEAWRSKYFSTYKDAYIGLCLPKLLNPLIRVQLLTWNPLEDKCQDFESMLWFESLLFYGCEEHEQEKDDADVSLLPTIVERVVLPKLTVLAENIWDPFSTTQTSRMVAITQKLINGYPSVIHAENKNTQMLLKALLLRMRRTLDDDVFMPLYPKNVLENKNSGPYLFFQRQFWSSVKLLGNFLQWHGILSNKTLQELSIDGLLNRYILMAFQNSECGDDSIKKAQHVISCFPKQWFTNLKGNKTISHLENLSRYLVHHADTIYRNSIGCSDVEKRNAREHIKQTIKLLASIRALDHAVVVANEHNMKELKILIEGK